MPPPSPGDNRAKHAFTLVELLIVVAIIAILAAIAVPNFLEAQTRAKVSRVRADLRTLATGIEAYAVDHNAHPIDGTANNDKQIYGHIPTTLTSPISYLAGPFYDPFRRTQAVDVSAYGPDEQPFAAELFKQYNFRNFSYSAKVMGSLVGSVYLSENRRVFGEWLLLSIGPDRQSGPFDQNPPLPPAARRSIDYDPTNGTVSEGDVVRSHKGSDAAR